MRLLAIDAAHRRPSAAVLEDERLLALKRGEAREASLLAALARAALAEAGWKSGELDAIAACVGPGSFTGIRAGLAFAEGIALVVGIAVIGVTTGEAYAAACGASDAEAPLWVATETRRAGRIYLERGGEAVSVAAERVAVPEGPIVLAGDAADALARILRARGAELALAGLSECDAEAIGRVAFARAAGRLAPRPPTPLYVDEPAARASIAR